MEKIARNDLHMYPLVYTPAFDPERPTIDRLVQNTNGGNPHIGRLAICMEAAVRPDNRERAYGDLEDIVRELDPHSPTHVSVRPADLESLKRILEIPGAEKLSGFVIAKAGLGLPGEEKYTDFAELAQSSFSGKRFDMFPILESNGIRKSWYRHTLFDTFTDPEYKDDIIETRTGAKDIANWMGIEWDLAGTMYDNGRLANTLYNIYDDFGGIGGFPVAAPVDGRYGPQHDTQYRRGVAQDAAAGVYGKTAIHTKQLVTILECYKVTADRVAKAHKTLLESAPAVTNDGNGCMAEADAERNLARKIIQRERLFGKIEDYDISSQVVREAEEAA